MHLRGLNRLKLTQGAEQGAFDRRPHQRCRNAFAHDIADNHIQAFFSLHKKIIEVAVNILRRDRQGKDLITGEAGRRVTEQEGLLNFRPGLDLPRVRLGTE